MARNCRQIETFLPLIGAVVDRALDQVCTSPLTSRFALYADFLRFLYRRGTEKHWI